MRLRDEATWQQWTDSNPMPEGFGGDTSTWPEALTHEQRGVGYGACVVIAARLWMDEMERRMAGGATVAEVADSAFGAVDGSLGRWGLTGFQYGMCVSVVAKCWEHGEDFRVWHNLETQIGDEGERANESGGVLNPALLSVNVEGES